MGEYHQKMSNTLSHGTEKLGRGPFCFSGSIWCFWKFVVLPICRGAKILVNHRGVSQKDVENFLSPRKILWGALLVFLKVLGIEELCVTGVSRFFVEIFLSHRTENFRGRDFSGVCEYLPVLRIRCRWMLKNDMLGKTNRERNRIFVVMLKRILIIEKKQSIYNSQHFIS